MNTIGKGISNELKMAKTMKVTVTVGYSYSKLQFVAKVKFKVLLKVVSCHR
jgi:hypothetical protein